MYNNGETVSGQYPCLRLQVVWLLVVLDGWMDAWMTCDFTLFSTVFQSYQNDRRVITKSCVQ